MYINSHDAVLVKASKIADKKLQAMGTDLESEIKEFIQLIASTDYAPFRNRIPNDETIRSIENGEKGIGLTTVSSLDELKKHMGW